MQLVGALNGSVKQEKPLRFWVRSGWEFPKNGGQPQISSSNILDLTPHPSIFQITRHVEKKHCAAQQSANIKGSGHMLGISGLC